jgi:hypothetical protein
MQANVGWSDRIIRVVIGALMIAFALRLGFNDTDWNWIGWLGVIPIATAVFGFCPLYSFLRFSTCSRTPR